MNDNDKCLNCTCTFETGCREEQRTNEILKRPRVRFIPSRLSVPPIPHQKRDPEQARANARENYRKRIERVGGTVRSRK